MHIKCRRVQTECAAVFSASHQWWEKESKCRKKRSWRMQLSKRSNVAPETMSLLSSNFVFQSPLQTGVGCLHQSISEWKFFCYGRLFHQSAPVHCDVVEWEMGAGGKRVSSFSTTTFHFKTLGKYLWNFNDLCEQTNHLMQAPDLCEATHTCDQHYASLIFFTNFQRCGKRTRYYFFKYFFRYLYDEVILCKRLYLSRFF